MAVNPARVAGLKSGDGGGTFDDMETRVSKLEEIAEGTRAVLEKIVVRLDGIDTHLGGIDTRLGGIDARLNGIDNRLDGIDSKLEAMDGRLGAVETRVGGVETRVGGVETSIIAMNYDLGIVKAKLDSKPDQGWITNVMGIMLAVSFGAIACATGIISVLR
jgi:archaellum component FlaC